MHHGRHAKLRADGNRGSLSFYPRHPLLNDLPGNVVSCLHSLVAGENLCHQWGSMRVREKDVRAIQEYIISASPCGEDFIFRGKALKGKQQKSVLSGQGGRGSGRKYHYAVVPWKASAPHTRCLFPQTSESR